MGAPLDLVDPAQAAFWASDPTRLTPPAPPAPPEHDPAALELAAAFLVVAGLIARHLAHRDPDPHPAVAARSLWARYAPMWARLATPAVRHAYTLGRVEGLSGADLDAMASDYAASLGDYLDTSSADALAAGFGEQLNGHWNERLAWTRAAAGYGLDRPSMHAHIAGLIRAAAAGQTDPVPPTARALVDKLLLRRADRIGQAESWHARQSGTVIAWLYRARTGQLPPDAGKRWRTAEDESTCPLCAPLDLVVVPLDEPWITPEGVRLWAPGAHPGCRCRPELVLPDGEDIAKAYEEDEHPRGTGGRCTRKPTRPAPPVAERDTEVDEIWAQRDTAPVTDKPSPFRHDATTDSPFRQDAPSPFASAGPFRQAGTNPFASGQANPFAGSQTAAPSPFRSSQTPKRRRIIRRMMIILPAYQPEGAGGDRPYYLHLSQVISAEGSDEGDRPLGGDNFDNHSPFWRTGWFVSHGDPTRGEMASVFDFDEMAAYATEEMSAFTGTAYSEDERLSATQSDDPVDHFDDIGEHYEGEYAEHWRDLMPYFLAVRADAENNVEDLVGELQGRDLRRIATIAGYEKGEDAESLRERITHAVKAPALAADPAGHPAAAYSASLTDAYLDYITLERPSLTEHGTDLQEMLEGFGVEDLAALGDVRQLIVFDQGLHHGPNRHADITGGREADLHGKYVVNATSYHSALGTYGQDAPVGLFGWSQAHVAPIADEDERNYVLWEDEGIPVVEDDDDSDYHRRFEPPG